MYKGTISGKYGAVLKVMTINKATQDLFGVNNVLALNGKVTLTIRSEAKNKVMQQEALQNILFTSWKRVIKIL